MERTLQYQGATHVLILQALRGEGKGFHMQVVAIWTLCLVMLAFAGAARGQMPALDQGLPGTEFANLTFFEARVEAFKKKRLLMVYVYKENDVNTEELEKRTLRNPTLAAYTLWHGVALKFSLSQARDVLSAVSGRRPIRSRDGGMRSGFPKVYVFRDRVAPTEHNRPQWELELGTLKTDFADMSFGLMGDAGGGKIPDFIPTPIYVLFQTDLLIEALKSLDPVWSAFHEKLNPEPEPPPPSDPLYQVGDDSADAVVESDLVRPARSGKHEAVVVDVLAQLDQARELARDGEWSQSAGMYTWLWERGEKFEPSFRPARRSIVAGEMRELFSKHPSTRGRFNNLRNEVTKRLRWAGRPELTEWFILNGVVGDEIETLGYLDLSINDIDEGSMLPRAYLQGYRLMMTRNMWIDPWEPAGDPPREGRPAKPGTGAGESMKRMEKLLRQMNAPRSASIPIQDWKSLDEFRREFFFEEACRLHAACLRAGFEQEAWDIAAMLLKVRDEGEAKLALVTTAMTAGQQRQKHLAWVTEAMALGHTSGSVVRDRLVKRLAEA
ncbi:MAG: hypothetical protein H7210_07585, partial [Pyrinomonadaceae bacterium]|nr:hypothetical protein [Phycisphaerales bacterium]